MNIGYWDGAAFEYADPEIKAIFSRELDEFKPDAVWFDYTYLWPLYKIAKKNKIPIYTRSINFEPMHFLDEDGHSWWNYLKSIPKFVSEYLTTRMSDKIFAITPKEAEIYNYLW